MENPSAFKISPNGPHICALDARKYAAHLGNFEGRWIFQELLIKNWTLKMVKRIVDTLNDQSHWSINQRKYKGSRSNLYFLKSNETNFHVDYATKIESPYNIVLQLVCNCLYVWMTYWPVCKIQNSCPLMNHPVSRGSL